MDAVSLAELLAGATVLRELLVVVEELITLKRLSLVGKAAKPLTTRLEANVPGQIGAGTAPKTD